MQRIEVMAPAGSWEALHAAINAGADSVYFGMGALNMRTHSGHNFTLEDLPEIVSVCQDRGVKSYVTLNAIIYDEDIQWMKEACLAIKNSEATAVIACDIAVIQFARSIGLNVHISTQLNVSNFEGVRFFSQFSDVIVLARELSLEQIQAICERITKEDLRGPSGNLVKIEIFIHGALCVSISGKCYMSLAQYNKSANRGGCLQACRRKYRVIEEETNQELVIDNKYIMSPKDLCTVAYLDQLVASGAAVFKIEGRGRSPEYVHVVTSVYREALESVYGGTFTKERAEEWTERLKSVYNRGFWHGGYYLGRHLEEWSGTHGSLATTRKKFVATVTNFFSKIGVAECKIASDALQVGDNILIMGKTTGVIEGKIEALGEDGSLTRAEKGAIVSFPSPGKVRRGDKVYVVEAKS